ncbi:hypothetical protein FNV43_RR17536 [Rhamnella rubrinervis]|uniref:Uncharacterized protein n=1 Tax=Rhamnella rubrinervis TaxID=2594499 RepID=A0A8K0E4G6_9ROSA|nr:hypothetical protein FNV43_RR17536 [Rhamnella rubrinervis]
MSIASLDLFTSSPSSPFTLYFTPSPPKNPSLLFFPITSLHLTSPSHSHFSKLKLPNHCDFGTTRIRQSRLRAFDSEGTEQGDGRVGNAFNFEFFLSVVESLCIFSSAIVSIGFAVSCAVPGSKKTVLEVMGTRVFSCGVVLLVVGVGIGAWIRRRQWRRISRESVKGGLEVNLLERIEKLEEDLKSSATIIRVLSRQLEKLGIRFRVTRKSMKQPIAEAAALAQKNSEATRVLAVQEDILEKELGEIQKVLLAMQEQQQKQLELILAIGKSGKLWETRQDTNREQGTIEVRDLTEEESERQGTQSCSDSEKGMERLRKLEELQRTMILMESHGIHTNSSDHDSTRFVSNLVLFMVQPCGELDLDQKCRLVSDYVPKMSAGFLEEASLCLTREGYQQQTVENPLLLKCEYKSDSHPSQTNFEEIAMVGLDAMQRANSTLEDFCRSYFMFHGMDVTQPQSVFKHLPVLSFTESYIYQLDSLNEKMLDASSDGVTFSERGPEMMKEADLRLISMFGNVFQSDPFRPLANVLNLHGLLTERVVQEFKCGEAYWALERSLCSATINRKEISVEDVMKAIHLKSFDYRVMNLLLYQLRGEQVNELHMDFLSISEFLVEVADDLFDYEDDVLENNFNILRMFVHIYGASAPTMLAKHITEAEEKYNTLLKTLDSQLSLNYQRRCEEATKEGGYKSEHPLGTWSMPPLILDEESYRSNLSTPSEQF